MIDLREKRSEEKKTRSVSLRPPKAKEEWGGSNSTRLYSDFGQGGGGRGGGRKSPSRVHGPMTRKKEEKRGRFIADSRVDWKKEKKKKKKKESPVWTYQGKSKVRGGGKRKERGTQR